MSVKKDYSKLPPTTTHKQHMPKLNFAEIGRKRNKINIPRRVPEKRPLEPIPEEIMPDEIELFKPPPPDVAITPPFKLGTELEPYIPPPTLGNPISEITEALCCPLKEIIDYEPPEPVKEEPVILVTSISSDETKFSINIENGNLDTFEIPGRYGTLSIKATGEYTYSVYDWYDSVDDVVDSFTCIIKIFETGEEDTSNINITIEGCLPEEERNEIYNLEEGSPSALENNYEEVTTDAIRIGLGDLNVQYALLNQYLQRNHLTDVENGFMDGLNQLLSLFADMSVGTFCEIEIVE